MAASVHTLPEELIVLIFTLYLPEFLDAHSQARSTLASVSKRWNAIVNETPSLFTRIHCNDSRANNSLALMKSRSHPLDVVFETSHHDPLTCAAMQESFREAVQHLSRWRSAILRLNREDNLFGYLAAPAPRLESISIEFDSTELGNKPFDLFAGDASRLRSLDLSGLPVLWTSNILTNLQVLSIKHLYSSEPSLIEIIRILNACPPALNL